MAAGQVRLIEADIRDRALMEELVSNSDVVFHQAALRITQCAEDPRLAMEVMVDGTFDLLELCVKHKVEKVVAASSASIYGMAESFPTTEYHHPYNNRPSTAPPRPSTRGCCAASTTCTAWTTWRCATSTSTARAWTSTATTPRC